MKKALQSLILLLAALLPQTVSADNVQLGDANCDGFVDISDVSSLIDYLLGNDVGMFSPTNADTDKNGEVGISDVSMLIDALLGNVDLNPPETVTFTVNGVTFTMVIVEGGTFTMGASDDDPEAYDNEKPAHQVTLSSYCIGQTEVTQELWQAVMGSNPSDFHSDPQRPVERVSWHDCQTFVNKLNELTGMAFRLPTEAEWEYAARGGNRSKGYKYAGSNDLNEVAWYTLNSSDGTKPVATKAPNELGIYDMSGNVWELCQDLYGIYTSDAQTNPTGPTVGSRRVERGGSWYEYQAVNFRVLHRYLDYPSYTGGHLGLRLALYLNPPGTETFTVNGVTFTMVTVEGGTFTMGATAEQGNDAGGEEYPTHQVTLSSYSIGQTEVTQELWQAVMGSNPSYSQGDLQHPVEQVSWEDCQTFVAELNELTGKTFRLPTEAEWEYAARGGNKSQGYKYAGSNDINEVAWYWDGISTTSTIQPVATKAPNELGIYDMSGNVYEWCQDSWGSYTSGAQTNPTGPTSGSLRVDRGGSYGHDGVRCRVSHRNYYHQTLKDGHLGLRLAL